MSRAGRIITEKSSIRRSRTARVSARPMQATAGTPATDAQAHRVWIGSVPVRRWNPALSSSGRMFGIIVVNG